MEMLENICYMCCCCFGSKRQKFTPKDRIEEKKQTLRRLKTITPLTVRAEIKQKAMALKNIKTAISTDIYMIPNKDFKTADEVMAKQGYTLNSKIGKGLTSHVFRATHKAEDKVEQEVACKRIDIPETNDDEKGRKKQQKIVDRVNSELYILEALQHPNIIKMVTHFMIVTKSPKLRTHVYIFMQLAPNGTLLSHLNQYGAATEDRCQTWFGQMLSAMIYMHKEGIAHRDLKLDNVLLDINNDTLIADFGFSKVFAMGNVSDDDKLMAKTYCGTVCYMAPEILKKRADDKPIKYSATKADVWSLGVILFTIFNNQMPYVIDKKYYDKCLEIMKKRSFNWTSGRPPKQFKDIINIMLEYDPNARKSMQELSIHPWIKHKFEEIETNNMNNQIVTT